MATSKVLKPRRGSTTEHATFKGQAFEITFDTDKKTIVAHDGLTMGGFPLAHEAAVADTDEALRALIDQKVSEVEGVSSSELRALDSALRGLISNNTQQQAVRDENQDNVINALNIALSAEATAIRALIADIGGEVEAAKNSVPTGTVIAFAANSEPPGGFLLCNGAEVSRTTYAALFAEVGTTYGAGDGSTTFNIPDMTDRFIQGSGTAGTVKAAGAPDIYGTFYGFPFGTFGAISMNLNIYQGGRGSDAGSTVQHIFQASRSNSIYGNSDTIQPPALTMRYYIKY